jgi:LysR family nitrogen assimilation transcriptional regulator
VAQPALGLQMRQLEQSLGVSLLTRHSRGVSPTRAGRLFYERACEILRLVEETERQMVAASRLEHENIALGLTNGTASLLGREIVVATRRELPSVQVSVVEEMSVVLMDALERDEIDIAFAYDVHERPGLLRVPLLEEELLFVTAADASVPEEPIEFTDVIRRLLVLPGQRDVVRRQMDVTARRLAIEINVPMNVSSIATIRGLVAQGDASTVMPYGSALEDIERGRLRGRRIVNPTLRRTLYFARSLRRAPIKREGELLDLLGRMFAGFADRLGPLAKRLPTLEGSLAAAVDEYQVSQIDQPSSPPHGDGEGASTSVPRR